MKTGTPRALKFSASVCSVTVFPVPVAPAIKPWRFAILGSKKIGSFDCATRMGSAMIGIRFCQRAPGLSSASFSEPQLNVLFGPVQLLPEVQCENKKFHKKISQ